VQWQNLTGGWNGLSDIPAPTFFATDIGEKGIGYLAVALTVLAMAAFARLSASPWGRAMRAARRLSAQGGRGDGINRSAIRALLRTQGAPSPARGAIVGRQAADAGDRARLDGAAESIDA
jgi:hypothetical protein